MRVGQGAALALACGPAAVAADGPNMVEELIVTGSRLPKADLVADSPIATVGREDIQKSGALTLDVVLNRLPQVVPSYSSAANNPSANGASYVNLRGLGENRNLVLLDGRRVIGANASNSVDLNTIPTALIDRVEVVTGGASAVYGADAVAGVVNVILKPRFEGLEATGRTLVSDRGDGREHEVSVTAGHAFDRANIMASIGWAKRDEIGKGERDFSAQAAQPSSAIPSGAYRPPTVNAPSQTAVNALFAKYGVAPGKVSSRGGAGGFSFNADGTLFATGVLNNPLDVWNYRGPLDEVVTAFYPDQYVYNFEPFNKLILPLERRSAAVFADAEVSDRITIYARALGSRYTADTSLAPTPAPTDNNPLYPGLQVDAFTVPVTNPFIPPDLAALLASRTGNTPALAGSGPTEEFPYRIRTVALGPRESSNLAKSYTLLGGAKVDLGGDWKAEAYASYGRYERTETQDGLLAVRKFEQLLDSPTGGAEFCEGGFNPFAGGVMSPACADVVRAGATFHTEIEQENAVATVAGPAFRLPTGEVQAVLGWEYRRQSYAFDPPELNGAEVAGFSPVNAIRGSVRFIDIFGELSAPLLADRPFAKALDLTLGYRRSDERTTGAVNSFKGELGWVPVAPVKLRAAVQRAVRAPDIFERYEPTYGFFGPAVDPCAGDLNPDRSAQVLELCRRQAVALGFDPAVADDLVQFFPEVGVVNGGNPDLKPEKATTYTVGVVWRPRWDSDWVGDFYASLDWYDIEVKGAIGYSDPQLALNACYNVGGDTNPTYDPDNPACRSFTRSSIDFQVVDVQSLEANQTRFETSGVDMQLGFSSDLGGLSGWEPLGRLGVSLQVSWLDSFKQQASAAQPFIDYAGTIGGIVPAYRTMPKWKGLGTLAWSSGPVELDLTGRFIDGMDYRDARANGAADEKAVGSAWYWDLSGRWSLNPRAELRAGVLNLFDRGPELYDDAIDSHTDPSTYDVVGRRFWIGLTLRL